MAFIKKSKTGRSWEVRHGRSGYLISKHQKRKRARKKLRMLHREFKPKRRNRGKRAKKRFW